MCLNEQRLHKSTWDVIRLKLMTRVSTPLHVCMKTHGDTVTFLCVIQHKSKSISVISNPTPSCIQRLNESLWLKGSKAPSDSRWLQFWPVYVKLPVASILCLFSGGVSQISCRLWLLSPVYSRKAQYNHWGSRLSTTQQLLGPENGLNVCRSGFETSAWTQTGRISASAPLDRRAAFDTVDLNILFDRLKSCVGPESGTASNGL